jgi:hypothetical protein
MERVRLQALCVQGGQPHPKVLARTVDVEVGELQMTPVPNTSGDARWRSASVPQRDRLLDRRRGDAGAVVVQEAPLVVDHLAAQRRGEDR